MIYTLLQKGAKQFHLPDSLSEEIAIFRKIVETKYPKYSSTDALDLGMTLWTTHFLLGEEDWAEKLTQNAEACLAIVVKKGYFDRPFSRRLAFRDFGTVLGVKCHKGGEVDGSTTLADKIVKGWESHEAVPVPRKGAVMDRLEPITLVMYATALNPGGRKPLKNFEGFVTEIFAFYIELSNFPCSVSKRILEELNDVHSFRVIFASIFHKTNRAPEFAICSILYL